MVKRLLVALGVALMLAGSMSIVQAQSTCDPTIMSCIPEPPPPVVYDDCGCSINYQSCPPCKENEDCNWWCRNVTPWLKWIQEM